MAYQTGTASDAKSLIDTVRAFASSNGWTVNRSANVQSGDAREICLEKSGAFINLIGSDGGVIIVQGNQSAKSGLGINGSTGYSPGDDWDRQPGYSRRNVTASNTDQFVCYSPHLFNTGPFSQYHLFSNATGDYVYLEYETSAGVWQRLGFGTLAKYDATDPGGVFFYATCAKLVTTSTTSSSWLGASSYDTVSVEEAPFRAAAWLLSSSNTGSAVSIDDGAGGVTWASSYNSDTGGQTQSTVSGGRSRLIVDAEPNHLNNVGILAPVDVAVNTAGADVEPFGVMPDYRYLNMEQYQPGQEFALGPDTWKVFPWYSKGGRSINYGVAIKKIV